MTYWPSPGPGFRAHDFLAYLVSLWSGQAQLSIHLATQLTGYKTLFDQKFYKDYALFLQYNILLSIKNV